MEYPSDFEQFWRTYGESSTNKGSKRLALASWEKVQKKWCKEEGKPVEEFAAMVQAGHEITLQNRSIARKHGDFVAPMPHAVTWLNQYRFEEEKDTRRANRPANAPTEPDTHICDECGHSLLYPAKGQRTAENCIVGRSEKGGYVCAVCLPKTLTRFADVAKDFYQRHKDDTWGALLRASTQIRGKTGYREFMDVFKPQVRTAFNSIKVKPETVETVSRDLTRQKTEALEALADYERRGRAA